MEYDLNITYVPKVCTVRISTDIYRQPYNSDTQGMVFFIDLFPLNCPDDPKCR